MGRGTVPLLRLAQMRVHEHLHSHSYQSWFTDPSRVKTTDAIKNERRAGKDKRGGTKQGELKLLPFYQLQRNNIYDYLM